MTATRGDGRVVSWCVEAWFYPDGPNVWRANVKAEIDLDDNNGDDRCVLNEQEIVDNAATATAAIRRACEIVVGYLREDLLTDGWQPPEWSQDHA